MVMNRPDKEGFITPLTYNEMREQNKIEVMVVDGLDAAGKGTVVRWMNYILNSLGENVVQVDLPGYDTRIGKLIKKMLMGEGLTSHERFSIYALNRLEILDEIRTKVENLYRSNGKEVIILFNRFSSSNILTLAYYLKDNELKGIPIEEYEAKLIELKPIIIEALREMGNVDSGFHNGLDIELSNQLIWIPQISPAEANRSLIADTSRNGRVDKYEDPKVQEIAYWLYRIAQEMDVFKFQITEQIVDGRRLSPKELAVIALNSYGVELNQSFIDTLPDALPEDHTKEVNFNGEDLSEEVVTAMNEIYTKYPNLRNAIEHLEG